MPLLLPCSCALLLFCSPPNAPGGTLEATWTGADSGAMRGTAVALWCAEPRLVEIVAAQGDTGLGIALRVADSLAAGSYPVVLPENADASRPSAAVGLRVLARATVAGYQGDSGSVTLEPVEAGRLGGRFHVRGQAVGVLGRITIRGRLAGVPVRAGGAECPAAS